MSTPSLPLGVAQEVPKESNDSTDDQGYASFLSRGVIQDQSARARRNEALLQAALTQQQSAMSSMGIGMMDMDEEGSDYSYIHPKNGPQVVATAIIRPQTAIANWVSAFEKNFLSLQKDLPIVIQTLRCTKEEGLEIMNQQSSNETPQRMPPQYEPCQKMTMEERLQKTPSQIGYLRITLPGSVIRETQFSLDCLLPCMYLDEAHPVVGLGPAVTVNASQFLWHLTNMLRCMDLNSAKEGNLIFDHAQIIFAFKYNANLAMSASVEQSSGQWISAPSMHNRQSTYLAYGQSQGDQSGATISNNTTFVVDTNDAIDSYMHEWYETHWSAEDLEKCIMALNQPKSIKSGSWSSDGDSSGGSGIANCKFEIRHAFVPPVGFRTGWQMSQVLPNVSDSKNEWWGFVESIHLKISLDVDSHVLSEKTLYRLIGTKDAVSWQDIPFYAIRDYIDTIAKSDPDGQMGAQRTFCKLVEKHWPVQDGVVNPLTLQDFESGVLQKPSSLDGVQTVRFNLKTLVSSLSAAKVKNCRLITKHSRTTDMMAGSIMLYRYDNDMPGAGGGSKHGPAKDGDRFSEPVRAAVSQYKMRPVTMVVTIVTPKVEQFGNATNKEEDALPNGESWSKHLPEIFWSPEYDYMTVKNAHNAEQRQQVEGIMQDYLDFADMDE